MQPQHEWLTIEEAANALKVGIPTIHGMIERGLLQTQDVVGKAVVTHASLRQFLRDDEQRLHSEQKQPADLGLLAADDSAAE